MDNETLRNIRALELLTEIPACSCDTYGYPVRKQLSKEKPKYSGRVIGVLKYNSTTRELTVEETSIQE